MSAGPHPSLFGAGAPREWTLAGGAFARLEACESGPLGDQAAGLVVDARGFLAFALGGPQQRARLFAPGVNRDRLAALMLDGRFGGYLAFEQDGRGALAPARADFKTAYGAWSGWRAIAYRLSCAAHPREAIYLDQLFVAPRCRRRGAARLLCGWLADAARRAGYRRILVDVARDNAAAIALYQSLGFRAATDGLAPAQRILRATPLFPYRRFALDLTATDQR